jgi:hypothetical protein
MRAMKFSLEGELAMAMAIAMARARARMRVRTRATHSLIELLWLDLA